MWWTQICGRDWLFKCHSPIDRLDHVSALARHNRAALKCCTRLGVRLPFEMKESSSEWYTPDGSCGLRGFGFETNRAKEGESKTFGSSALMIIWVSERQFVTTMKKILECSGFWRTDTPIERIGNVRQQNRSGQHLDPDCRAQAERPDKN